MLAPIERPWANDQGVNRLFSKLSKAKVVFAIVTLVASVFLASCGAVNFVPGRSSLATGPRLVREFSNKERDQANAAIELALNAPGALSTRWGKEGDGNSGRVTPGTGLITGLTDGREIFRAPAGIHVATPLETALGQYRLVQNANVRLGPTISARRLTTLPGGTQVRAIGRDNRTNWYLIVRVDTVVGYIYGPLMEKVADDDLVLTGGPTVRPTYCRAFLHDIRMDDGRSEKWSGAACRKPNGNWAIKPNIGAWM